MQYLETRSVGVYLYWFYLLAYYVPYITFLEINEDNSAKTAFLIIALLTSLFFLAIEVLQAYDQGLQYFVGWNIVDVL